MEMEIASDDDACGANNSHNTVRRIMSEGILQNDDGDTEKFDPYRALERSQSDASLIQNFEGGISSSVDTTDDETVLVRSNIGHNVSECSTVYYDLSKAVECEVSKTRGEQKGRPRTPRALETIPQDEELQIDKPVKNFARSISSESTSSIYEDSASATYTQKMCKEEKSYSFSSSSSSSSAAASLSATSVKFTKSAGGASGSISGGGGGGGDAGSSCGGGGGGSSSSCSKQQQQEQIITTSKTTLKSTMQAFSQDLYNKIHVLHIGSTPEQIIALREMLALIDSAWSTPVHGRDLAYRLCDIIRDEGALERIVSNCGSSDTDLMQASGRVLDQIMTTENREAVAKTGLDTVVQMTYKTKNMGDMSRTSTGILESLFKTSESTCREVIKLGGLDVVLHWSRYTDRMTLRHCAFALANLALYGGPENQELMIKNKVAEWLFPLAFNDDDSIRYYACLAISALVSNKEIEAAVIKSGTMELVLPFIENHTPTEFAQSDQSHQHGCAREWLTRLIPVLSSKREEAQALAAFHFAMEAGIKAAQDHKEVFYDIGCINPLKRLASSPNATASKLAIEALRIIGEEIPHKLTQQVPLWTAEDVSYWVNQIGFTEYVDRFEECRVDGDLLLMISEFDLQDSIKMSPSIKRKRFIRELKQLKTTADYSSCDHSRLNDWLREISAEFSLYTYQMLRCGIDKAALPTVTEAELEREGHITNSIHRRKIMSHILSLPRSESPRSFTMNSAEIFGAQKTIDAFISYRRSNGSQLASLLKVHLQLRGFSVFLDIERLRAGKFDDGLLNSIERAENFILVLTPQALDRCIDDVDKKDWVHREIVEALQHDCNIIPLMDNFEWPPCEKLPEDIRSVARFNGVRWIHDYQDACVDKIERFLRGEQNMRKGQLQSMSNQGSFEEPGTPRTCLSRPRIDSTMKTKETFDLQIHKKLYCGGCHCGEVRFQCMAPEELLVIECNCSICFVKQNSHFIVHQSNLEITKGEENLTTYRFNTMAAQHMFCKICGVQSFYIPRSNQDSYGVNPRCLDSYKSLKIKTEHFNGEDWERSIVEKAPKSFR
ncbi:NAD(+) hydrolase sarm1 [Argonauta hians]